MTEPQHLDPERLAALLDGRLGDAEAAAVRAQLADADDETLAAYADAMAISKELAAADGIPDIRPAVGMQHAASRPRWVIPTLAMAATIMIALVLARGPRPSGPTPTSVFDPSALAATLAPTVRVPTELAWGSSRGGEVMTERGRSARVGALLMDLSLSARRGDTAFATIAMSVASLLDGVPAGGPTAQQFRLLAGTPPIQVDTIMLHAATTRGLQLVDGALASAAAWTEAARAASTAGDTAFLVHAPAHGALSPLLGDAKLEASTRLAIERVLRDVDTTPRNSSALVGALESLLRELAR